MKKNLKFLTVTGLVIMSIMSMFVGCGSDDEPVPETISAQDNQVKTPAQDNVIPMTKKEYDTYLIERYNYYFNNPTVNEQYSSYNIYAPEFAYNGTYQEFLTGFDEFTTTQRENLEAFKKDLETNVRFGNPDVDRINSEIITSVDRAIASSQQYTEQLKVDTNDIGDVGLDEFFVGLREFFRFPYLERESINRLIEDAKDRLGVQQEEFKI